MSWRATPWLSAVWLTAFGTAVSGARAECIWLVVGASDVSAAGIARKAAARIHALPAEERAEALVVRTEDCGEQRGMFAWSVGLAKSREAAAQRLERLRGVLGDAYVKKCMVRASSLLAFRISAVDRSIAKVPDDAVNWDEAARLSTSRAVSGGAAIVVVRHYEAGDADDPLEGRRERVLLRTAAGNMLTLSEDCPAAADFETSGRYVAFECAREQAADEVLHEVRVVSVAGQLVTSLPRCRAPRFGTTGTLTCQEESVDAEGALRLLPKRTSLKP